MLLWGILFLKRYQPLWKWILKNTTKLLKKDHCRFRSPPNPTAIHADGKIDEKSLATVINASNFCAGDTHSPSTGPARDT